MKSFLRVEAYNNEDGDVSDLSIKFVEVVRTNGEYTLSFSLESDGDGVIDKYHFYDVKSKVYGQSSAPWDFEEFSDVDYEWTEHESLEDFGFDSNEIGEEICSMRSEFIEKYLNEELNKDLYNFKVPFNKKDTMNIDEDGNLIFEEGDKNILPPNR